MKIFITACLLVMTTLIATVSFAHTEAVTSEPAEAQPLIVWVDVRSAEEFAAGHLEGAVNIVHTDIAKGIAALNLDKSTPIALYCKSGRRAGIALDVLQNNGYSQVTNHGGYEALLQTHATEHERQ
ncbi:rhodanese-like domain-containing protein [Rheinheimera baltica]|uniref:rhodanese-like domain-containing protein n=1 Tax=Rheinheimera baltica TaxID=67576 RepID=UPI00273F903D|nr:rhodanese-like domain-containing protein [Rheinheimera baltica]MDP5190824.1 rhodanese-like domain-containing protein [Rheinheimera baltica]